MEVDSTPNVTVVAPDRQTCVAEVQLLTDVNGTCLWFDRKKGYGFIELKSQPEIVQLMPIPMPNVFAHQSEVQMTGFRFLQAHQDIVCNVVRTVDNRFRAAHIRSLA